MGTYIDGFVFPIPKIELDTYKGVAEKIAAIWLEFGAIKYTEYVGEDLTLEGTRSFVELADVKEHEVVIFSWILFPSKDIRDSANKQVANDARMAELLAPLVDTKRLIFDAERMVYGGFQQLISVE